MPRFVVRHTALPTLVRSSHKMSDEAYAAFLETANKPVPSYSGDSSQLPSKWLRSSKNMLEDPSFKTLAGKVKDEYFVSESDEKFHPICIDNIPDEFEEIDAKTFDPHQKYKKVIHAIEQSSGSKDIHYFSYEESSTKTVYYVLAHLNDNKWFGVATVGIYT